MSNGHTVYTTDIWTLHRGNLNLNLFLCHYGSSKRFVKPERKSRHMNHQRILDALVSLGLSQNDAKVYIHLAARGPQEAWSIADALRLQEQQLCKALENLKNKGIATSVLEGSTLFFALPFNNALELLVEAHLKEAKDVELNKDDILCKWHKIVGEDKGNLKKH